MAPKFSVLVCFAFWTGVAAAQEAGSESVVGDSLPAYIVSASEGDENTENEPALRIDDYIPQVITASRVEESTLDTSYIVERLDEALLIERYCQEIAFPTLIVGGSRDWRGCDAAVGRGGGDFLTGADAELHGDLAVDKGVVGDEVGGPCSVGNLTSTPLPRSHSTRLWADWPADVCSDRCTCRKVYRPD